MYGSTDAIVATDVEDNHVTSTISNLDEGIRYGCLALYVLTIIKVGTRH